MASSSSSKFQDLNQGPPPPTNLTVLVPKLEPLHEPSSSRPRSRQSTSNPVSSPFSIPSPSPLPTSTLSPVVCSGYNPLAEIFLSRGLRRINGIPVLSCSNPDSLALVSAPEARVSNVVLTSNGSRKYEPRGSELVRFLDVGPQERRIFLEETRRTRMMFDSLSVFLAADLNTPRSARVDMKAASLMKDRRLWLYRDRRVVGDLPGVSIGDVFFFRMEMCVIGLHGQAQSGIDYVPISQSSNGEPIATSIVVSGGYEDDEDFGDVILYTGHGGQDNNGRQITHQKLECGNLAMERSMSYGIEVRVIRGLNCERSPSGKVFVYDGLYKITETRFDRGKSGWGVFKFKLVRIENQKEMGTAMMKFALRLRWHPLAARPNGTVSLDLSRGKEKFPIYVYNDIDACLDPINFGYLVTTQFPPGLVNGNAGGCDCAGACQIGCLCAEKNGGKFAYDLNGILVRGKPLIFECGPHCKCPPSCGNRVTQQGIRNRFEVFRSRETGWGVRSLDVIQAGSFICEYAGIIRPRVHCQIFPNRFAARWKEWGNLSEVIPNYVIPTYPSVPPPDFGLDVSTARNVACYMSHSSLPNVMVQLVLYDHHHLYFPHLMLFAMENIPPMRELSLDYGVEDETAGKLVIL